MMLGAAEEMFESKLGRVVCQKIVYVEFNVGAMNMVVYSICINNI